MADCKSSCFSDRSDLRDVLWRKYSSNISRPKNDRIWASTSVYVRRMAMNCSIQWVQTSNNGSLCTAVKPSSWKMNQTIKRALECLLHESGMERAIILEEVVNAYNIRAASNVFLRNDVALGYHPIHVCRNIRSYAQIQKMSETTFHVQDKNAWWSHIVQRMAWWSRQETIAIPWKPLHETPFRVVKQVGVARPYHHSVVLEYFWIRTCTISKISGAQCELVIDRGNGQGHQSIFAGSKVLWPWWAVYSDDFIANADSNQYSYMRRLTVGKASMVMSSVATQALWIKSVSGKMLVAVEQCRSNLFTEQVKCSKPKMKQSLLLWTGNNIGRMCYHAWFIAQCEERGKENKTIVRSQRWSKTNQIVDFQNIFIGKPRWGCHTTQVLRPIKNEW